MKLAAAMAFKRGFDMNDLLANPYPDGSIEARHYVDGWVARIKAERV